MSAPENVNVPTARPEWWRDGDYCWLGIQRELGDERVEKLTRELEKLWGPCCPYPVCSGASGYQDQTMPKCPTCECPVRPEHAALDAPGYHAACERPELQ